MIYKLFINILLLVIALAIAGFIDLTLSKFKWPPFGAFVGGLLIGLFVKNKEVLYSAFGGILYIALAFVIIVAMGLGVNLTTKEVLGMLFSSIRAVDYFKFFSMIVLFILGGWVGRNLKKRRKKDPI